METMYTVYRRLDTEDTGEDFSIRVDHDRVEYRSGAIDEPAVHGVIPAERCHEGTPWMEMRRRTNARLDEGFAKIGLGRYEDDQLRLTLRDNSATLALHWVARTAVDKARFSAVLQDIKARLRRAGIGAQFSPGGPSGEPALEVSVASGAWRLDRLSDGRFGEHMRPGIARVYENDGTVGILVLMRIDYEFPDTVQFGWYAPGELQAVRPHVTLNDYWVGAHVVPFQETLRVANALGVGPARRLLVTDAEVPQPVWF